MAKRRKQASSPDEGAKEPRTTAFQQRLYKACKLIPAGKVTTYGTLAKVLKSSARAVGQGMRRNPYAPVVPCHRVIAADCTLGGFSGSIGPDSEDVRRKRSMLIKEGVQISGEHISSACVLDEAALQALLGSGGEEGREQVEGSSSE